MAEKDTMSRKYILTINNPAEKDLNHEKIKLIAQELKPLVYMCMADEIGLEDKTPHTHVYLCCKSGIKFSRIKRMFPVAHIDQGRGTSKQIYEYITKTGKWEDDEKSDTSVEGTFEEWGEMPNESQGARNDLNKLYDMIDEGMSTADIINENKEYLFDIKKINEARDMKRSAKYMNMERDIKVIYVYGETGVGKTSGIYKKHGYEDVYATVDGRSPWDDYDGQSKVVFDEYRSDYPIKKMLKWLDRYPQKLEARYYNRVACFDTVYIVSNIPLENSILMYRSKNRRHGERL